MSKKQKIIFGIVFIGCFLIQILPVVRNGFKFDYGLGFWGSNGHDAIWHLSLINNLKNPFKIDLPIFAGETLKNYHPFFDILIAFFALISNISSTVWYFQIFPIITTILFLITSFLLGKQLTSKFSTGIFLMFFNSFASSFGWIISLFKSGTINGESLFWAMQSASNQLNPPFLLSLLFINCLLLLVLAKKINFWFKNLLILLILIITPITKAYGGVAIYLIFALYSFFSIKKSKQPLILLLISLPLAYLVFSIYNKTSGSLFIFKPFWFVNSLIESPDRFYVPVLANMRYTLEASGKIGPRLIAVYFISTIIFYLGNFSWRILGLLSLKSFKSIIKLPLLLTILITGLIPLFLIQKGTSWNTIQFMYYSLFISNIFLAIFVSQLKYKYISLVIIILTIIPSWENLNRYLSNPAPACLSNSEIEALTHLKDLPQGIVLTYPYDKYKKNNQVTPIPLYIYETSAYVSAFSKKSVFLEDEMNLDITGFDWKVRRKQEEEFFSSQDKYSTRGFLLNNNIDYIYLLNGQSFTVDQSDLQIDLIFENSQVKIFKVRK